MKRQCGARIDHFVISLPLDQHFFFWKQVLSLSDSLMWKVILGHAEFFVVLLSDYRGDGKCQCSTSPMRTLFVLICISFLSCLQLPEKAFAMLFPGCLTNTSVRMINDLLNLSMHACEKWLKLYISLLYFPECQMCTILQAGFCRLSLFWVTWVREHSHHQFH